MGKLTDELRREHSRIMGSLQGLGEEDPATASARARLKAAHTTLLAHITKEEIEIYDALDAAAETDMGLRRTLQIFGLDTVAVTRAVMAFFGKWLNQAPAPGFRSEFEAMLVALRTRIHREEELLFKEYDRTLAMESTQPLHAD